MKKYGSILRFYHFLGEERLLLADAESIRHVLVTNSQNYPRKATSGIRDLVPEGLFVHEGPQHRSERKLLNPSFNNAAVQGLVSHIFLSVTIISIRFLGSEMQVSAVFSESIAYLNRKHSLCGFNQK